MKRERRTRSRAAIVLGTTIAAALGIIVPAVAAPGAEGGEETLAGSGWTYQFLPDSWFGAHEGSEHDFGLRLDANEKITSKDGKYDLIQQPDGNLVLENVADKPLWSTQTHGNPGARTHFQHNGNLVVVDKEGEQVLFSSQTADKAESLVVQDDGNLVMNNSDGNAVWSSQAQASTLYHGQSLRANQYRMSPDQKLRFFQQDNGNLVVGPVDGGVTWQSETAGNEGAYIRVLENGNVAVVSSDGERMLWTSGTSGHPGSRLELNDDGVLGVVTTDDQVAWANVRDGDLLTPGQTLRSDQSRTSDDGRFRLIQAADGNLVLQDDSGNPTWASGTHGHPGARPCSRTGTW